MKLGNNDCIIINDIAIKNKIIDYIFSKLDLSQYRYSILKTVNQLHLLKKNEHYVSPNFKGFNYLTVFLKINSTNYCVLIDRRKMSYHKDNINFNKLNMYKVKVCATSNIFKGTIFDSKLIKNFKNEYMLLIKDCYICMNNSLVNMSFDQKLVHIDNIISNHFEQNPCKNFKFIINKLFTYDKLEYIIYDLIKKIDYETFGLIFFPKKSGHYLIYMDNTTETNSVKNLSIENINDKTYDIITNYEQFLKSRIYSYEKKGKTKKFWLKKNNFPDVYDIFENEGSNRIGIACIPNLKISHYCNQHLKHNELKEFNCIYSSEFGKWIPINIIK